MLHLPESKDPAGAAVPLPGTRVVDANGHPAQIVSIHAAGTQLDVLVRPEHGREIMLPAEALEMQTDGSCLLPFAFGGALPTDMREPATVIPVLQEELQVGKRVMDTGKGVRVNKVVVEREQTVDVPLLRDEVLVERVPAGHTVALGDLPVARYEGDTLIVPVLEEVLILEKRMRLKEEIRITKRRREMHVPQTAVLKEEQVTVERFDERRGGAEPDATGESTNPPALPPET